MPITKSKKVEMVSELDGLVANAKTLVFVNFHKLPVAETTMLRRKLRDSGVGMKVAKKTLIRRVLDPKGFSGTMPELPGEIAVAFSIDQIAPAREVHNFEREHRGAVSIAGGVFDGKYMTASEMMSIATIPSLDTLRAQFLMLINSPLQQFVVALDQIAAKKSA